MGFVVDTGFNRCRDEIPTPLFFKEQILVFRSVKTTKRAFDEQFALSHLVESFDMHEVVFAHQCLLRQTLL
jgi:hypothetical protein